MNIKNSPVKSFYIDFFNQIIENEDREVEIVVVNILENKERVVKVVPNMQWKNADGLLGVKLRYECVDFCENSIFQVKRWAN
jgi:hypothetical protein